MIGSLAEAAVFFCAAWIVSALFARYASWRIAWFQFMFFPGHDAKAIERQTKNRTITPAWFVTTLVGASLVAGFVVLMPSSPLPAIYLLIAGIAVIVGFAFWQGARLFEQATSELGIEWPPRERKND